MLLFGLMINPEPVDTDTVIRIIRRGNTYFMSSITQERVSDVARVHVG